MLCSYMSRRNGHTWKDPFSTHPILQQQSYTTSYHRYGRMAVRTAVQYDTRHKQALCALFLCRVKMDYEKKTLKNVRVDKNTTRLPSGPQSPTTSKCIRSLIDCDRAVVCKGQHPAFAYSSAFCCRREALPGCLYSRYHQ